MNTGGGIDKIRSWLQKRWELPQKNGYDRPPDKERMAEIASEHGITYEINWIPELVSKYHLQSPM